MNVRHFFLSEETKDTEEGRAVRTMICLELSRLGPAIEVFIGEEGADHLIVLIAMLDPSVPLPQHMIDRLTLLGITHPGGVMVDQPEPTHEAPATYQ